MGRPKKDIDYDLAYRLARIHCTNEEIALCVGVSAPHWYKLMKSDPALCDKVQKARAEGRASLRRLQWQNATQGNVTMQIWLGKQILSQTDTQRTELTGRDGEAIRIEEEAGAAREIIERAIARAAIRIREESSHIETDPETTH
jgi:hypothetical protein